MNLTDPRCGRSWNQHGNRSGHCAKCHETFEGIALWDAHQTIRENGSVQCKPAQFMLYQGFPLISRDGSWRSGKPFDAEVFA